MISPTVEFVGFQNFIDAAKSPAIRSAFVVTYKFLIIFVPMALIMSMGIALLVNSLPKLKGLYMVAFFSTVPIKWRGDFINRERVIVIQWTV